MRNLDFFKSQVKNTSNYFETRNKTIANLFKSNTMPTLKNRTRISSGAQGVVYKGILANNSDKKVAIKYGDLPELVAEYKILSKLQGLPGVPYVYDIGGSPGNSSKAYMYYEYIDGETLNDWMRRRVRTRQEYRQVLLQIFTILGTILEKFPSFRHGDLHAENIMVVTKNNQIILYLIDFGFSHISGIDNPALNNRATKMNVRSSPKYYDYHTILLSIYEQCRENYTKDCIEYIFSNDFRYLNRKNSNTFLNNYYRLTNNKLNLGNRLRGAVNHPYMKDKPYEI